MKPEFILLTIVGGFLCALIIFLVIFYKPVVTTKLVQTVGSTKQGAAASDTDAINSLKSKVKWLEEQITSTPSAEIKNIAGSKSILATASIQGGVFTTSSAVYTPMGIFININCPKNCLLSIHFYSSSTNLGPIASEQGNLNTYNLYLDGVDKSIFSAASLTVANSSAPVSLNSLIPVTAGTHTVEIKTKTTGGTLQSDSSSLQIIAIEK